MIYLEKGETLILQVIEKWTLHYHQKQQKSFIFKNMTFQREFSNTVYCLVNVWSGWTFRL